MLTAEQLTQLEKRARQIRVDILKMITAAGSGHPGGSLSLAEIMAALYFKVLRVDPAHPRDPNRDRLILSKGHAAPVLYAALAHRGFFPRSKLTSLRKFGSCLQGHPDMNKVPGVDVSTGSLGQGLSVANGMALAAKMDRREWRVYVILGDGECQEGQVWEAAMAASHYRLDNLTAILDYNGLQIDGVVEKVMGLAPLADKWRAFGWQVTEIDGHNLPQILQALENAASNSGKPQMIIAKTIKGKGVSFMENEAGWHGSAPSKEQLEQALRELGAGKEDLV